LLQSLAVAKDCGAPRPLLSRTRRVWNRLAGGLALAGGWGLVLGLVAPPTRASSPAAWQAYDAEVRQACLKASLLKDPRVLGERIDVPVADVSPEGTTPLISALLLEGRFPQPHMRGQKGRELCLFEQRTRRATVAGAEAIDRPRLQP
jgi:hypothetical protein